MKNIIIAFIAAILLSGCTGTTDISGSYHLEAPNPSTDPRYAGSTISYELILNQDATYRLIYRHPIVEYVEEMDSGNIHEEITMYIEECYGNYTVKDNVLHLKDDVFKVGRIDFKNNHLYLGENRFESKENKF